MTDNIDHIASAMVIVTSISGALFWIRRQIGRHVRRVIRTIVREEIAGPRPSE